MGVPYAEVIGEPIAHSKSPLIHNFWLDLCGIEGRYVAVRVSESELGAYFADRKRDPDWQGCNVTRPLKEVVLEYSCLPDEFVGAANILSPMEDRELLPTNADYTAIYDLLAGRGAEVRDAVVLGSGGAARAALAALRDLMRGDVALHCRSPEKGRKLLEHFELPGSVHSMDARVGGANLLINATPLGMTGCPALDIDLGAMSPDAIVFDMVYSPVETDLVRQARDQGMSIIDGLDMLIEQADSSFQTFFRAFPPRELDSELRARLLE
jgi:shikimate dehydrogenase